MWNHDSHTVRARPAHPPARSAGSADAAAKRKVYLTEREGSEQRSQLRGLVWMALLALLISLLRAGAGRTFYAGWWRQW